MKDSLKVGMLYEKTEIVTQNKTALACGSGTVDVYATPAMIALMENAAYQCVDSGLSTGTLTVGTYINVQHLAATPVGMTVTAKAELVLVEDKRLEFRIEVYDEKEMIGEGTHVRYIVNAERFMQKAREKNKQSI